MSWRTATTIALALTFLAGVGCNDPKKKRSSSAAAPVNSGTGTGNPTTVDATFAPVAATSRITSNIAALAFAVVNTGQDPAQLAGVTVTASGTIDESTGLGAARLVGDDNGDGAIDAGEPVLASVPAPAFMVDDGTVSFALAVPVTIAAGATLDLIVAVDATATGAAAAAEVGKTIELAVAAPGDLVVTSANQQVTPGGTFPGTSAPVVLFLHDHLLISEIVPLPTAGEYVEIFNATAAPVDLTDVYLSDATDQSQVNWYYNVPTGTDIALTQVSDWFARFPAGATIASGQTITIAVDGADFQTTYGQDADYCLRDAAGATVQMLTPDASTPPVWSATPVSGNAGLTNGGEPIFLFTWDGTSDLVQDVDYVYYGTDTASNTKVDKTNVSIDGPDADTTATAFQPETAAFQQALLPVGFFNSNDYALQRVDFNEGGEVQTGGNGVTGHEETSEDWDATFTRGLPTPGTP